MRRKETHCRIRPLSFYMFELWNKIHLNIFIETTSLILWQLPFFLGKNIQSLDSLALSSGSPRHLLHLLSFVIYLFF